eukprot:1143229-Pelagomonas_calceolata.AAC.3
MDKERRGLHGWTRKGEGYMDGQGKERVTWMDKPRGQHFQDHTCPATSATFIAKLIFMTPIRGILPLQRPPCSRIPCSLPGHGYPTHLRHG